MEIPAWFETLFEKVVVVFEMPASETLQAAGSTTLLPWLETLLAEAPLLVENVRAGLFPSRFLTNVLGFGQGFAAKLPGLLTFFVIFYLLCGGATVALRLKRKQTSLLTFSRQVFNALLTWAAFLVIPMRKALVAGGAGEELYAKIALLLAILAVIIPICSVIRYIWIYRLTGIPHAIFDVGFGLFVAAVLLLSAKIGFLRILILLAIAALTVVQWEEPEYEEVPVAAAKPAAQKPAAAQSAPAAPQKAASAPQRAAAAPQRAVATPQRAPAAPQKTAAAPQKKPAASQVDFSAILDTVSETLKKAAVILKEAAIVLYGKAVIAYERLSTDIRLAMARRSGSTGKTAAPAKPAPAKPAAAAKPAPQPAPAKPVAPPQPAAPAESYPTMDLDIEQIIAEVESATEDTVL